MIQATRASLTNTSRRLNVFVKSSKRQFAIETELNSAVPKLIIRKLIGPAKVTVLPTKCVLISGSVSSLKILASFLDETAKHRHNELLHFDHAFNNSHVSPDSIRVTLRVE